VRRGLGYISLIQQGPSTKESTTNHVHFGAVVQAGSLSSSPPVEGVSSRVKQTSAEAVSSTPTPTFFAVNFFFSAVSYLFFPRHYSCTSWLIFFFFFS